MCRLYVQLLICVSLHLIFFSIYRNCCFLPSLYVSQVNHLPLTLFFTPPLSCFTPRSSWKCNHIQGLHWAERRGLEVGECELWRERGVEEEKGICMCTQLPLQQAQSHLRKRTGAHALKIATSILPPLHVCWLQLWWGRRNNAMAFLLSVSSELFTRVCFVISLCNCRQVCVSCVWLH